MTDNRPVVTLSEFNAFESYYRYGDRGYRVKDMIKLADREPVFELPLAAVDISGMPWDLQNVGDFLYHVQRMNDSSLDFPVILDNEGIIADGWHRICKAIIEGRVFVEAVRLTVMPEPIPVTDPEKRT